jgi:hypothetical protein
MSLLSLRSYDALLGVLSGSYICIGWALATTLHDMIPHEFMFIPFLKLVRYVCIMSFTTYVCLHDHPK